MTKILSNKSNIDLDYPICRPSLDLDFTQEVLDPRITFSRGSIGTRVNRNRLIETVSANQPRFDYDPVTGECKGLLIEESRSNYWRGTQTGGGTGTVSDGTAIGADGVTAKKFVPTLGSTAFPGLSNYTQYSIPVGSQVVGGTVDISFSGYFAAIGTGLYVPDIVIAIGASGSNYIFAELVPDLTNGTVWVKGGIGINGITELIAPQITLMPFGMYKVTWSVRYTQGATIRNTIDFGIQCRRKNSPGSATGTYYADGVNGFQYSCIQYEIGAFPTSYIPTTASTVTRSADNASMTGTNFSSWYNQTEGTIVGDCSHPTLSSMICSISDGTINNRLQLETGTNTRGIRVVYNGVSTTSTLSYTYGKRQKFISSYTTNTANYANAGILATTIKISGFPTANNLRIGANVSNESQLNSSIARLTYYPRALKPNQLRYLTQ